MSQPAKLDSMRRILLLASGRPEVPSDLLQLDLPLSGRPGAAAPAREGADLTEESERAHSLALELLLLILMEMTGLAASPLQDRRRRRMGLGSDPPLRLLAEWERARPIEDPLWSQGVPAPSRERAYAEGLGRVRALAESIGLTSARMREILRRLFALASRMAPEENLPGLLLTHGLRHRLMLTGAGRLIFQSDRDLARRSGAVHTPPELALELTEILFRELPPRDDLEVLDPACGGGQFLLAAARCVAARPGGPGLQDGPGPDSGPDPDRGPGSDGGPGGREEPAACFRRLSRVGHLNGVDLDPRSARIAAFNLSYWAAREAERSLGTRLAAAECGTFLDQLFGPSFPYLLGRQIQVGNALQIEPAPYAAGFLWEKRFAGVFQRALPGFDVVLGNPPWISHGLRGRMGAAAEERLYYERLFPAGTQYKLSLYPIFMELALRLCRPGGVHGFIVPDSVLSGHHFSRIRRQLLQSANLLELAVIEAGVWPGVQTGHVLLYAAQKKGGSNPAPVSVRNRWLRPGRPVQQQSLVLVPATQYSAAGDAALRVYREQEEMDFLTRIMAGPLRIRDVAWTYSGLIARYGQKSVQSSTASGEFRLVDDRGVEIFRDSAAAERWRAALWSGAEVVPHRVRPRGGWIYWPEAREDVPRIYKSGYAAERYEKPKVFLRQTGDSLIAAADSEGLFCFNNIHLLGSHPQVGIPPLVLAGILQSAPLQKAYRILSLEAGRPLAQVDLKTIEGLPFPTDASGIPAGAGPLPPRSSPASRRILRSLERVADSGRWDEAVDAAAEARRAGDGPYAGGPLRGCEALTLILHRLLELRAAEAAVESAPVPARRGGRKRTHGGGGSSSALQRALDEIAAVLFQIEDGASRRAAAERLATLDAGTAT